MSKLKTAVTVVAVAALCLDSSQLRGQQAPDSLMRRQQRTIDSLSAAVRALQSQMDSLARTTAPGPTAPQPAATQPVGQTRASGAYMNVSFVGLTDAGWSTEPDVAALQVGDHDPHVRGFSIPNAELALDGNVDPYFKAFANIVYKLDAQGETGVELEEMYALSSSLPWNLQLKVGQYFLEFGRQNNQHPHAWAFADQPLVLNRMFGPEGLRSQGARLSWLFPTSWYTEAMISVVNSAGGTTSSFRSDESSEIHGGQPLQRQVLGGKDLLFVPRIATSLDLTETQTIVVGVSAALGPNNSGPDASTQIYGADLYWKWKSARAAAGFPFVSFQAEALTRTYDAAARSTAASPSVSLPGESLKDGGAYGQVLWGIRPLVVAGLRGEFASGNDAAFASELRRDRYRVSPNFTWYPTEFSKFRVQYNYDHRAGLGIDHSVWFQLEYLLGAHAAHKF